MRRQDCLIPQAIEPIPYPERRPTIHEGFGGLGSEVRPSEREPSHSDEAILSPSVLTPYTCVGKCGRGIHDVVGDRNPPPEARETRCKTSPLLMFGATAIYTVLTRSGSVLDWRFSSEGATTIVGWVPKLIGWRCSGALALGHTCLPDLAPFY